VVARAKRNQVFISYSQKDAKWLRLIKEALLPFTRKNELDVWDDSRIKAGDRWRDEITVALQRASVAVMLVSRNFLASNFIAEVELPTFLDAASREGLRIIWIAVGDCAIETTGLKDYKAANDPAHPLNSLGTADLDRALTNIARTVVAAAHPNKLIDLQVRNRRWDKIVPAAPLQLVRKWPKLAAASGLLILAALVWGGFWLPKNPKKPKEEVTILVADLDGPEDYKVTQAVLALMRESVENKIPNVRIVPLAHKITEQEGPQKAIEEGRKAEANLVLWGYYNTSYRGKVHIEQIKTPEPLHLLKGSFDLNPPIAASQGLTVEEDLSSELNYLVFVVTGLIRFEVGDYRSAIECYDGALKERSAPEQLLDQIDIYYFRGQAFLYLDADESLDHYRGGSNTEGSDKFYLGGDAPPDDNPYFLDQAIGSFTTVIAARPGHVNALSERAYGYARKGEYPNALNDYDRILKDSPSYAAAHMGRGIVHNLMKDYDQAIADYNQAERLEQNSELYYNRAISFEQKSDYQHALADYNHAISINKDDVDSKINRASLYETLGYYDEAVTALNRAFDGISPTPFYYSRRGQAWAEIGDHDKALSDFSSLIGLAPDSAFGYHLRGHLFRDLKRYDEAIADFSKVVSVNPKAGYARNDLATCWVSKGNFAEALKNYSEATSEVGI
jgi:tetratricopeptide (TPR) repeat protein